MSNKYVLSLLVCYGGIIMAECRQPNGRCRNSNNKKNNKKHIHKMKRTYAKAAKSGSCCPTGSCTNNIDFAKYIGYSDDDITHLSDANLGLGCGNPITLGDISKGDIVLDLGSGAGFDCLIAAKKVGPSGKIIGIDMTREMVGRARTNARKYGFNNVEFVVGDIEHLPLANESVDIILSNCVISLAKNKLHVFKEAYRVLKPGGKMFVSDIVLLAALTPSEKKQLITAGRLCPTRALQKNKYLQKINQAGFMVTIVREENMSQTWFGHNKMPVVSLKFVAIKK